MLSRKVVTLSGRRFRGYFPSYKMGRTVAWESLLELAAIHLLEFSRGVLSYREQPVLIQYPDGEHMLRTSFKVDLVFIEGQTRWQIRRRLATGKIPLESDTGEQLNLSDQEIRSRWLSQTLSRRHGA